MTSRASDPLDLLRQLPTPEPDPARMQATIAAARARFMDEGASRPALAPRRRGWRTWLATGAVALAAVAVVAVLMPPSDAPRLAGRDPAATGEGRDLAPDPAAPPGLLAEAPPAPTADSSGSVMGARPPQALPPGGAELLPMARRHDFAGLQIIERDTADGVALSLLRGGTETAFDRRSLDPGVGFELLDAFLLASAQGELLLLQSRIGDATNWDVFTVGPDDLRLSGELSRRIYDAPDRATAAQRLSLPE